MPCGGENDREQDRHCREQAAASSQPKARQRELVLGEIAEQHSRDQVTGDYEEHIDARVSARKTALVVEQDDGDYREGTQAVDLGAVRESIGRRNGLLSNHRVDNRWRFRDLDLSNRQPGVSADESRKNETQAARDRACGESTSSSRLLCSLMYMLERTGWPSGVVEIWPADSNAASISVSAIWRTAADGSMLISESAAADSAPIVRESGARPIRLYARPHSTRVAVQIAHIPTCSTSTNSLVRSSFTVGYWSLNAEHLPSDSVRWLLRLEEVLRGVLSSHRQRASRRRECNETHGCDCDEWD
jgi:hypothetical protein